MRWSVSALPHDVLIVRVGVALQIHYPSAVPHCAKQLLLLRARTLISRLAGLSKLVEIGSFLRKSSHLLVCLGHRHAHCIITAHCPAPIECTLCERLGSPESC